MSGPATYRIRVRGGLRPNASDSLRGLSIRPDTREDGAVTTTLEGPLPDQAALVGILNALYERHLPVISVMFLDPRKSTWEHVPENGGAAPDHGERGS
jgi:hypothetical protein